MDEAMLEVFFVRNIAHCRPYAIMPLYIIVHNVQLCIIHSLLAKGMDEAKLEVYFMQNIGIADSSLQTSAYQSMVPCAQFAPCKVSVIVTFWPPSEIDHVQLFNCT